MKNLRPETLGIVEAVEHLSGCPVEFVPDSGLEVQATLQKARNGAKSHQLRYRPNSGPLDYWVAYQCGFAQRFYKLPPDQRFDFVDTGEGSEGALAMLLAGHPVDASDRERAPMFARQIEQWALMTLLSYPVGMRVDQWLYEVFPALRDLQAEGMAFIQAENLRLLSLAMGRLTIPVPLMGMPAAYALFTDQLLGVSQHAIPYRGAGVTEVGEALLETFNQSANQPADDRALIDAWAQKIGIASWYKWRPYKMLA